MGVPARSPPPRRGVPSTGPAPQRTWRRPPGPGPAPGAAPGALPEPPGRTLPLAVPPLTPMRKGSPPLGCPCSSSRCSLSPAILPSLSLSVLLRRASLRLRFSWRGWIYLMSQGPSSPPAAASHPRRCGSLPGACRSCTCSGSRPRRHRASLPPGQPRGQRRGGPQVPAPRPRGLSPGECPLVPAPQCLPCPLVPFPGVSPHCVSSWCTPQGLSPTPTLASRPPRMLLSSPRLGIKVVPATLVNGSRPQGASSSPKDKRKRQKGPARCRVGATRVGARCCIEVGAIWCEKARREPAGWQSPPLIKIRVQRIKESMPCRCEQGKHPAGTQKTQVECSHWPPARHERRWVPRFGSEA